MQDFKVCFLLSRVTLYPPKRETRPRRLFHSTPGPCAPFRPLAQIRQRSLHDRRPRRRPKTTHPLIPHPTPVALNNRHHVRTPGQVRTAPSPATSSPRLGQLTPQLNPPPQNRATADSPPQILPIDAHRYDAAARLDPGGAGGRGELGAAAERELLHRRKVREV